MVVAEKTRCRIKTWEQVQSAWLRRCRAFWPAKELGEFFAELCRFIMFTGLFFWLLTNGPEFGNDIITSLCKIGDRSGTGASI